MDGLADNIRKTVKEDRNDVGVFFQKAAQNTPIATIMNNPNKIYIIRILRICFLGCLGTCNTNAFTTSRTFSSRVDCSREKRTVLSGGYYAEPEPSDQSQTHMLFGTRFREETWNVNGKSIITLMPSNIFRVQLKASGKRTSPSFFTIVSSRKSRNTGLAGL